MMQTPTIARKKCCTCYETNLVEHREGDTGVRGYWQNNSYLNRYRGPVPLPTTSLVPIPLLTVPMQFSSPNLRQSSGAPTGFFRIKSCGFCFRLQEGEVSFSHLDLQIPDNLAVALSDKLNFHLKNAIYNYNQTFQTLGFDWTHACSGCIPGYRLPVLDASLVHGG